MMNMFWQPLDFEVPLDPDRMWHVAVDTFAPSQDRAEEVFRSPADRARWRVQPRSIVILVRGQS
jgi:glycogen operon protein